MASDISTKFAKHHPRFSGHSRPCLRHLSPCGAEALAGILVVGMPVDTAGILAGDSPAEDSLARVDMKVVGDTAGQMLEVNAQVVVIGIQNAILHLGIVEESVE